MKKTAFLFPGQGSQSVGMGQDFYEEFSFVKDIFDMIDEVTRLNISRLCFKGPMEELTRTVNLQPAVTAVNLAILAALEKEGIQPDLTAGHSLGEYAALHASKVLDKENTVKAVMRRGELMHREALKHQGAMVALIGIPFKAVEDLISAVRSEGVVSIANHNAENQIVITGAPGPVQKVAGLASAQKAKAVALNVSGAWHSDLMKGAEAEFAEFLSAMAFKDAKTPVVQNVTGDLSTGADAIRDHMVEQLCSPVRWYDSVCRLMDLETEVFVEIGPGRVLSNLVKKILPKGCPAKVYSVGDLRGFELFLKEIA